jgi:hypothetical protein
MSLRVGVDLDGVVADFRTAFEAAAAEAGVRVVGGDGSLMPGDVVSSRDLRRVWDLVKRTPNWWVHLAPYEPAQIPRLYELTRRLRWEVVFMTRRPATAGDPVQFQSQWWLEQQGFYYPAVVTVPGSRGDLANALRLDVVVDDQLMNCIDVVAGSTAKAVFLMRDALDAAAQEQGVSRGVGVVSSFEEAVDVLEHLHETVRERRGRLQRLADWFTGPKAETGSLPISPDPERVRLRND